MVGQTLAHYEILEKLGEGGMGVVYLAKDITLDRKVALKILPPELAQSPERLERFQREAKTLAALDHPNIVTIHTVEEANGVPFLTMQLVEGKPLSQLISKGGMPLERIFEIAIPLTDALATAHEQGVIHRDLKPANIMVTDEGRVKVLDFGLAKLHQKAEVPLATELPTEPLTEEGRIVGTIPYMSPEQLEGKEIDARSDIFSLGVVLYEMTTGERPFQGETSVSLMMSIGRDTPATVDAVKDGLPHHLGRVIARCLEKGPKRRYQTALDVHNELSALRKEIDSGVLRAHTESGPPAPASSNTGRWLWVAGLVGVISLMLGGLAWMQSRAPTAPEAPPVPTSGESPPIRSLAVLPFDNLMGDLEQDYFVEGMHDALIAELAQIDALAVISRQSVLRYRDTKKSIPEIAQELGVDAIVEGSVFRAEDTVRITAQLIGAIPTERNLWAESYERDLRGVLALQREVARAITTEIDVALTGTEQARFASQGEVSPEAYDYYLRGNQYFNRGLGGPDILIAVDMFERSVAADRSFALAHAALSKAHARMHFQKYDPSEDRASQSLAAAERALALDPDLPEARAALGWYHYWVSRDFDRALEEFISALSGQPNNSDLLLAVGLSSRRKGKWSQALRYLQLAFKLDPLSNEKATEVGISHFFAKQYDAAADYFEQAIAIAPDHHRAYMHLTSTLLAEDHSPDRARRVLQEGSTVIGREEFAKRAIGRNHSEDSIWLAVEEFEEELSSISADEFGPLAPMYLNFMSELHARHGRTELQVATAQSALAALQSLETPNYVELSRAHASLGHRQEAIRAAEEAVRQNPLSDDARGNPEFLWQAAKALAMVGEDDAALDRLDNLFAVPSEFSLGSLATDPIWIPLRDHPRFQALLDKYGRKSS